MRTQLSIRTDQATLERLADIVRGTGWTQRDAVERAVSDLHATVCEPDPPAVLGYIELRGPSEAVDCVECGQPARGNTWLRVTSAGHLAGPYCGACRMESE